MLKKTRSKASKSKSITSTKREQLPQIHSPISHVVVPNATVQKNPPTSRSISSNLEISHYSQPSSKLNMHQQAKKNNKNIQQIMIEFVPDKFYVNENSQVNFMAYPVIPSFTIPATFPNLNLN